MKSLKSIIFFTLLIFSRYTFSNCTLDGNTVNQTVYPGTVTVQRDALEGSVFWSKTLPLSNQKIGGCTSGPVALYYSFVYNGGQSAGITHYYKTPLSGVAMSVTVQGFYGENLGYYDNPRFVDAFSGPVGIYTGPGTTISLIKTGPITPGVMPAGQIGLFTADSGQTFMKLSMGSLTINQVACSITTPTLNFPIGDILASSFGTSIGTVPAAASKTENLGLSCDAGTRVNVTLTGVQNPDVETTSILALTDQGQANVAKGVGVQILYNNSPINLNGSPLYWKTSSGGQEIFPITVRYYQTKTAVTTGTANASATLNITYQ